MLWCDCVTELGLLSGIAAILRFPISDPDDEDDDENDNVDASSDADWHFTINSFSEQLVEFWCLVSSSIYVDVM